LNVSLIVTTYNWPAALSLTLATIMAQTCRSFDLVIADDGSKPDTADVIKKRLAHAPFSWRHVRHEDDGIRQARVKNLAVKYAQGDYLIFIDHDVVLHTEFLNDHISHSQEGCFLQGKRVFLSVQATQKYLNTSSFNPPSPFQRGMENRKNAFRLPKVGHLMARPKEFQVTLRGCNLSMSKDSFIAVDGYDEVFDGLWGREDSDICYRMFNSGIRIKNLWFCAIQYHLHHPAIKHTSKDRLDEELERILKEKRRVAVHGFSSLSAEGKVISGNY
jgi:glycosyltransferase involved in cell wall biosynthesis